MIKYRGCSFRTAVLIALLLLSIPLLFSCSDDTSDITTDSSEIIRPEITEKESDAAMSDTAVPDSEKESPLALIAKEYTLVYGSEAPQKVWFAAKSLSADIGRSEGIFPKVLTDTQVAAEHNKELLIGETNRAASLEAASSLNYMDYTIRITEDAIVIVGGSPLATVQATQVFSEMLFGGKISSLSLPYAYDYDFDRFISDSLAYNQEAFIPKWADEFTPPEWMLDFEEKLYALYSPTGRISATAHRGDVQHYPENSLEGILSAIMLGADAVEIDVRLTKDNVMVLMHDATLNRTTDWKYKKGKNGLPTSANIADWTYEQLRELRLLERGKATSCVIPTLYEAALLFDGRAQLHIDCKVPELIDKHIDIYPLAEETGTKECFLLSYGYNTMREWLVRDISDSEFKSIVKKIALCQTQMGSSLRKSNFSMLSKYGDHPNGWRTTYSEGYKLVFTDKIYDFCIYTAKNAIPLKPKT